MKGHTSRVSVPEKWSRPAAAAMAWAHGGIDRCQPAVTSPRSLPPWRRPRQTHSRANSSANADSSVHVKTRGSMVGDCRLPCTMYMPKGWIEHESEVPRGTPSCTAVAEVTPRLHLGQTHSGFF